MKRIAVLKLRVLQTYDGHMGTSGNPCMTKQGRGYGIY